MNYKINKYIYHINKNNVVILNNLLNNKIFAITQEKYNLLREGDFSLLQKTNPHLFSAMEKLQVIVPESFDEINQVKLLSRKTLFNTLQYRLTLNPTLECNFKCWYCYEQHSMGKMAKSTFEAVINHIQWKITNKELQHLQLDWFGGEPLMYFEEIIYPLSCTIKDIIIKNNLTLSNSITTNGYLINAQFAEKMSDIKMNNFQITLDGNQETHDKIRNDLGKGSFQTIIDNINLLSEYQDVKIAIRINYTEKNLKDINNIIPLFSEKAKSKIVILFQQVWQDSVKKFVSADKNKKVFEENGITVRKYALNTNGYVCYADFLNQAVINYDGRVFKCTARDFENTKEDGLLLPDGEIQWYLPMISKRMGNATFENERCMKCNLLPACIGPCSQKMMEFSKDKDFRAICLKDGVVAQIERNSEDFYIKIQNKNALCDEKIELC